MAVQFLPEEEQKEEKNFLLAMNLSNPLKCSVLTNKNEISVVLKNGTKIKSEIGNLYFFNDEKEPFKKAAIFVKKNIGKAFYRNYIKRIIRFYIRSDFTLFEKYNRVIFFYNYRKRINYKLLKEKIEFSINEDL